jgi:hypothetical protein
MKLDVRHLPYGYQQTPSVDELLATVITLALLQTVADDEEDDSGADYIPGYGDGEAEPSKDEETSFE